MATTAIHAVRDDVGLTIEKLGVFCGAGVTGIDLRQTLTQAQADAVLAAHAEHGVLVFPGQHPSAEQLVAFGRRMGELTVHPFSTNDAAQPELIVFDNKEGNPPPSTDIWHSDETFRARPPMGTILSAQIIPSPAGDTAFCSMAALYEGLSDRMQQLLSGLEAMHDFITFKKLFANSKEGRDRLHRYEELYRPTAHPLVRVHPVTGRKAIFVNRSFTTHIKGMDEEERAGHPRLPLPPDDAPRIPLPAPLAARHGGVLGQPVGAALRAARLLSRAPDDAPGDDQGRPPGGRGGRRPTSPSSGAICRRR